MGCKVLLKIMVQKCAKNVAKKGVKSCREEIKKGNGRKPKLNLSMTKRRNTMHHGEHSDACGEMMNKLGPDAFSIGILMPPGRGVPGDQTAGTANEDNANKCECRYVLNGRRNFRALVEKSPWKT